MHRKLILAAGITGLLLVSSCGNAEAPVTANTPPTETTTSVAISSAKLPPSSVQTTSAPASSGSRAGSIIGQVEDEQGYRLRVEASDVAISVGAPDITDAKPGFSIVPIDAEATVALTNVTPSRTWPGKFPFEGGIGALYPVGGVVCEQLESSTGGSVAAGMRSNGSPVCELPLVSFAQTTRAPLASNAEVQIPTFSAVPGSDFSAGFTVTESVADAFSESAANPIGWVAYSPGGTLDESLTSTEFPTTGGCVYLQGGPSDKDVWFSSIELSCEQEQW